MTKADGVQVTCNHIACICFCSDAAVFVDDFFSKVCEANVLCDFVAQVGRVNHTGMFVRVGSIYSVTEEDEWCTSFNSRAHDFFHHI